MNDFLLKITRVCIPSFRCTIRECCLAIVQASDASPRHLNFSSVLSYDSSTEGARVSWACSNLKITSVATSWNRTLLMNFWLQRLSAFAMLRNLMPNDRNESAWDDAPRQSSAIASRYPGNLGHMDSKWNLCLLGATRSVWRSSGAWYEAQVDNAWSAWFGCRSHHPMQAKARSILESVGWCCSLLHVNNRPWRCNSVSSIKLRALRYNLELLLSAARYIRLKSPHTSQGPRCVDRTCCNSLRNNLFSWSRWGPYTTKSHHCSDSLPTEVSLMVKECASLWKCDPVHDADFHAMRIPPLVSTAGTK
jgi:hypothetical protein